jgi:hypothetical protein
VRSAAPKKPFSRYATATAKTERTLGQKPDVDLFIEELISACEHARKYKRYLRKRGKGRTGKSSKPIIRAIGVLVTYLEQYPFLANYQVALAELQAGTKLAELRHSTEPLAAPRLNSAELLRRTLDAFRERIAKTGATVLEDIDPELPQIGNLLYPWPDDVWENFDAKPKLPKKSPTAETMLAFELACRFRYRSLGRALPVEPGDFGGVEMPKEGRPHFSLVHEWVEAAFGPLEATVADLKKRVDKLVAGSHPTLRKWPPLPSET